jgi:predicted transcriptional regulator of viral defense system
LLAFLGRKPCFSVTDLAVGLKIKPASANVLAARYAASGVFLRLKRDCYVLAHDWPKYTITQYLTVANFLQVPSYVSFMTALSYHEVTTQVPKGFFENASHKRTARYETGGIVFVYYRLDRQYYFGFSRQDGVFISTPEKALIDVLYLYSLGRYKVDFDSLDLTRLDRRRIRDIIKVYPDRTRRIARRVCNI